MTKEEITQRFEDYLQTNFKEKYDAIVDSDHNVLLSAGAGCGKTTALSMRVLYQVVCLDRSVTRMLILTFTNKAAQEMRDRIKQDLRDAANGKKGLEFLSEDSKLRKRLTEEADKVDTASIVTFDSYTQSTLKKYAQQVGINPDITVLDESIDDTMFKESCQDVLTETLKQDKVNQVLKDYLKRNYQLHTSYLITALNNMRELDESYSDFDSEIQDTIKDPVRQERLNSLYLELGDRTVTRLRGIIQKLEKYRSVDTGYTSSLSCLSEYSDIGFIQAVIIALNSFINEYERRIKEESDDVFDALKSLFASISSISFKGVKNPKKTKTDYALRPLKSPDTENGEDWQDDLLHSGQISGTDKAVLKKIEDSLKKVVEYLKRYADDDRNRENLRRRRDDLEYVYSIYQKVKGEHLKKKAAAGGMTFSDISNECLRILRENPDIRESERSRIDTIMVDEYQDSNDSQEQLLQILGTSDKNYQEFCERNNPEDTSGLFDRGIVFMVGDVKQSIYRFRNAKPKLFQDKYDSFSRNENPINRLIAMTSNYRSCPAVIDPVNTIFERVMTRDFGEVDYKNDTNQQIECGNESLRDWKSKLNDEPTLIEFSVEDLSDSENRITGNRVSKKAIETEVGIAIADRIRKLVDGEDFTLPGKDGKPRRIRYGDFAILVQNRTPVDYYTQALDEKGIPYKITYNMNIKEEEPLVALRSLLKLEFLLIQRDVRKISLTKEQRQELKHLLASVDRSYFANLPDWQVYDDCRWLDTWLDTKYEERNPEKEPIVLKKLRDFNKSRDVLSMTPTEIFDQLTAEFGAFDSISALDRNEIKEASISWLTNTIQSLTTMSFSMGDTADFLRKMKDNNIKSEEKIDDSDSDAVTIITIHASKGLQYPIVFTPISTSADASDSKIGHMIGSDRLGVSPSHENILKEASTRSAFKERVNNYQLWTKSQTSNGSLAPSLMTKYSDVDSSLTLEGAAVANRVSKESSSEEVRLLYVALTRAIYHNYIVYYDDGKQVPPYRSASDIGGVFRFLDREKLTEKALPRERLAVDCKKVDALITASKSGRNSGGKDLSKLLNPEDQTSTVEFQIEEPLDTEKLFPKKDQNMTRASKEQSADSNRQAERFGTRLHAELESLDWSNFPSELPDTSQIDKDALKAVQGFIDFEPIKDLRSAQDVRIYQELAFLDPETDHSGSIDFAATYTLNGTSKALIVDYKASRIEDPKYDRQLQTYRRNLSTLTNIPEFSIDCYLYSLETGKSRKVD